MEFEPLPALITAIEARGREWQLAGIKGQPRPDDESRTEWVRHLEEIIVDLDDDDPFYDTVNRVFDWFALQYEFGLIHTGPRDWRSGFAAGVVQERALRLSGRFTDELCDLLGFTSAPLEEPSALEAALFADPLDNTVA